LSTLLKPSFRIERLHWRDEDLGEIVTPRARLAITRGVGSGLSRRPGAPPGLIWAITDRGPNIKMAQAIDEFGLAHLERLRDCVGAKLMPRPDIGPALCELRIVGENVELVRVMHLRDRDGRTFSGLPIPSDGANVEPAFDMNGVSLGADVLGADTEAVAAHTDGSFFVTDEYGPSILKVDDSGTVQWRWMPAGLSLAMRSAAHPVIDALPAIASQRRLNRGFEAIALSPSGRRLFVAFQSALAVDARRQLVRIWRLNAETGAVDAQFFYPFDDTSTFARDRAAGSNHADDLKLCELQALDDTRLLVLERITHTSKVYIATLDDGLSPPPSSLETGAPLSASDHGVSLITKRLIFSTDDAPEIDRDLEGMLALSPHELLLVNDNDFGVEGVLTSFWRIHFDMPLLS